MASMRMRFISLAALLAVAPGLFGLTANARAGMPYPTPTPPTRTPTVTPTAATRPVGDGNRDGVVDSIDAALVLQYVAALLSAHQHFDLQSCCVDVNEDGRLDAIDAALILQYSAGLLLHLPP